MCDSSRAPPIQPLITIATHLNRKREQIVSYHPSACPSTVSQVKSRREPARETQRDALCVDKERESKEAAAATTTAFKDAATSSTAALCPPPRPTPAQHCLVRPSIAIHSLLQGGRSREIKSLLRVARRKRILFQSQSPQNSKSRNPPPSMFSLPSRNKSIDCGEPFGVQRCVGAA